MAKKKEQKSGGSKDQTKCIKMVRNPRNGAYYMKEDVVPNDKVEEFFKQEEDSSDKLEEGTSN